MGNMTAPMGSVANSLQGAGILPYQNITAQQYANALTNTNIPGASVLINAAAQQANYNLHIMKQQMAAQAKPFKINGKEMELQEFVETLFPEDCPERTYLLLRLTKGENDDS